MEQLNSEVSCDNQKFVLFANDCSGFSGTCNVVATTNSYVAPACSSQTTVNTLYTNSRSYWTENATLMNNMISGLKSGNANSLDQKFAQLRTNFKNASDQFDQVELTLKNTIENLTLFSDGFNSVANCLLVRKEFLYYESAVCFGLTEEMFYMSIFLLIAIIMLLCLNMGICCIMRNSKKKKEDKNYETETLDIKGNNNVVF